MSSVADLEYQSLQSVLPDAPKGWTRKAITKADFELLSISRVEGTAEMFSSQDHEEFQSHGWAYERGSSTIVLRAFLIDDDQSEPIFQADSDVALGPVAIERNAAQKWGVIRGISYRIYDAVNFDGEKLQVVVGQSKDVHRIHIEARGLGKLVNVRLLLRAIDYEAAFTATGENRRSVRRPASSLWRPEEDESGNTGRVNAPETSNANAGNSARERNDLDNASQRDTELPGQNCRRNDGLTRCIVTQ
ncbi:MAG: hypothetical protein ABJQ34_00760 [Paracoccaceae bacterium]